MTPLRNPRLWLSLIAGLGLLLLSDAGSSQQNYAAAKRLLQEAERLERSGSFEEADGSYQLLLERFPESQEAEAAILSLARSQWRGGNSQAAHARLEELIDTYPESPRAASAWVLQAQYRIAEASSGEDLKDARTLLRRVPLLYGPEKYPTLDARVESRVTSGEVNLLLGEPAPASVDFIEAIEDEPASPWLSRARYGLARSLLRQGKWQAASEILQRVADSAESEALATEARRSLTFIHRLWLRPSVQQLAWESTRAVNPSGIVWKKPMRVAAAADGRVLVIDSGARLLLIMDVDGTPLHRSDAREARDVWWGFDGEPYVATAEGLRAVGGSLRQSFVSSADKRQIAKNIGAGQRGLFGHWLMVDREKKALMVYEPGGRFFSTVSGQEIVDVALEPRGEILVLDRKRQRISRLGFDFKEVDAFTGNWRRPQALCSDAAGNIYVLDRDEARIHILAPNGGSRGSIGPALPGGFELGSPEDISLDGEGRLYIADSRLGQVLVLE